MLEELIIKKSDAAPPPSPEVTPGGMHPALKIPILLTVGAVSLTLISHGVLAAFTADRIYPNISIAGTPVGGMTKDQATTVVNSSLPKGVRIRTGDTVKTYALHDLGLRYDTEQAVSTAFNAGHKSLWAPAGLASSFNQTNIDIEVVTSDPGRFEAETSKIAQQTNQPPTDATIAIHNGEVNVTAEKSGKSLDAEALKRTIAATVKQRVQTPVVLSFITVPAAIKKEGLSEAANRATVLMSSLPVISANGKQVQPSRAVVGSLISLNREGNTVTAVIDQGRLASYVSEVARTLDNPEVPRRIQLHDGTQTEISAGQNGTLINQAALKNTLQSALGNPTVRAIAAETYTKPFATFYNQTPNRNGKFIEVNISRQRLWAYENGRLVHETPVTTGAVGIGRPTIAGNFAIYAKQTNRYLDGRSLGYNYRVFVNFWMPFTGDYGLHDASWRANFGGRDYVNNGSSGCVNMPQGSASWMYAWAPVGTPVWVHY